MKKVTKIIRYLLLLLVFFAPDAWAQDKETWTPVAMHMATTVSDGSLSLDEILKAAREEGVKAVIVTDRDFMKWEYGFKPLEKILKKTVEANSVFRYGFDKYLSLIELEAKKNPDLLVIMGLESAPFYYWKGRPFSNNFKICDWHKHLLVILPDHRDYRTLPVFLNPRANAVLKTRCDVLSLWPLISFVLGIIFLGRRECSYKDNSGRELGRFSKKWCIAGATTVALSLLFLINNFLFCRPAFNQYCLFAGSAPYQTLINYVSQENGVIFWAHPEASYVMRQGRVMIETNADTTDLWRTAGYTGFSIFPEGYEQVGKIGGDWDKLLKEYCAGTRLTPAWAVAGLAFDQGTAGEFKKALRELSVMVLASESSRKAVLEAMQKGRVVVTRGGDARLLRLEEFSLTDEISKRSASLAEELVYDRAPMVHIKGHADGPPEDVRVVLIRDGAVLKEFSVSSPFDITYKDEQPLTQKTFYRLEIRQTGRLLVTNPIFAKPSNTHSPR